MPLTPKSVKRALRSLKRELLTRMPIKTAKVGTLTVRIV